MYIMSLFRRPLIFVLVVVITLLQGNKIMPESGSLAAIDTGTTLVGGPSSAIAAIYNEIPGSVPLAGKYEGYYSYRARKDFSHHFIFFLTKYYA